MPEHHVPSPLPVEPLDDQLVRMPHRPMPADGDMDITPMIDITFLLLIFFLVATRMDTQSAIELPKARNGTAVAARNSVIITMTAGPGDLAQIYTGDGTAASTLLASNDLAEQEQQLVAYVEAGLNAPVPKQDVLIKAEPKIRQREVARVAKAIGQIPDLQLYVAVYEVQ